MAIQYEVISMKNYKKIIIRNQIIVTTSYRTYSTAYNSTWQTLTTSGDTIMYATAKKNWLAPTHHIISIVPKVFWKISLSGLL